MVFTVKASDLVQLHAIIADLKMPQKHAKRISLIVMPGAS